MCCFFTSLVLLGPRFAILIWWLISPLWFSTVFDNWFLPLVMAIFAPWTTIMYLIVWSPATGIYGFDWVWIGLAIALDVFSYTGSAYKNRQRFWGREA